MKRGAEGLGVAIGLPSAVLLVMGGMIGVGIFVNPAVVARFLHAPYLVLAAWGAGGVVALLGAFVYAELAARFPHTGGEYVYLRDTYGPLAGFLFGWATLLVVQTGGLAAVSIVFARNIGVLAGAALPQPAVVVAVLAGLAAVNCQGVRAGNGVQAALGVLKVACIAALVAAGLLAAPQWGGFWAPPHCAPLCARPPGAPANGMKAFGAAMIPVAFSYGGWQTASYVAGEMKNPARNLSRALVAGVACVIALYLLVNVACLRALGVAALGRTLTPLSDILHIATGTVGARLAAAVIALSALAYMSQSMLTGPRVSFAMARDGLFFRKAAHVGAVSRAPVAAILLQAAWSSALALTGSYEQILSYVTAMNFLFFGLSASCLFVARLRGGPPPPYRAPLHPYSTGLFMLACAAIVACSFWAYPMNSLLGYAFLVLGVPPFLFWRRQRRREVSRA